MPPYLRPLAATFVVFGSFWGAWAVLATDLRHALDASYGTFGLLVSVALAAAAMANALTGGLAERWGTGTTLTRALALWAAATALVGLLDPAPALAAGLVAVVAVGGAVDVAMNVVAAAAFAGRPGRLVQFHGLFNAGAALGALTVGSVLHAGASWRWVFTAVAGGASVVALWLRRVPLPATDAGDASLFAAFGALRAERLVGLGILFAAAALVEGGIETWGVLFLRDELGATAAIGAAGAVAAFSVVAVARIALGPAVGARGARAGIVLGAAVAAAGITWLVIARSAALAAVGLVAGAAGASMCWPLLVAASAAGRPRPGVAIGAVTAVGYLGFVVGPTVVGWVAGGFGLPAGLVCLASAAAAVAVAATRLPPAGGRR